MTHEDALNFLLSNCCGRLSDDELKKNGGVQEFCIQLHCKELLVKARKLENLSEYNILSVEEKG